MIIKLKLINEFNQLIIIFNYLILMYLLLISYLIYLNMIFLTFK